MKMRPRRVFAVFLLIVLGAVVRPAMTRAADDVPPQTGAFLAYCKTNNKGCVDQVAEYSFAMLITNVGSNKKWCPAKETDDVNLLTPKVVQWLTAHPETHTMKTSEGIETALKRLYPCK